MDHLNAIDIGVVAQKPYNEIARKVFLTYPTKAFVGKEEQQFEILDGIASHFRVPITCIQVAGSAKLGYSLHKKSTFTPGQSDLDLAIIDAPLFSRYLEIGLKLSKSYSDGTAFSIRNGVSTMAEYHRYLTKGIFRPDLMPIGKERAEWSQFFGIISSKHSTLFKSISAAIYISQSCFENKQRSAIKAHATKEFL